MAQSVVVETGPARSGKTYRLLERYRSALRERGPRAGRLLWIAPTGRAATAIREQLLSGGVDACLAPGVTTFDGLVELILREAGARLWPIDDCQQRELVRRVVDRGLAAGRLEMFAATSRSAGFVDLMVEHLRELKRREIEPDVFANAPIRRERAAEHRALAELYADYQRLLGEHALADREGRHWIARDCLAAGECPSLAQLELVVVDGFTDFTPTQQDMLRELARRSEQLVVSLPLDSGGARRDLFAKSAATLAELQRRHRELEIHESSARPSGWPALDFLAANLFGNPRRLASPSAAAIESLERWEVVAAAGEQDEIVQLARRIKQRLASGETRPGEIAVVFRTLPRAAGRIEEVFTEFDFPFAFDARQRLVHAPEIKSLLGVLRLAAEDWPFRRVVTVITNNALDALGDASRLSAEWLVRDLQIASGRDELFQRVDSLVDLDEDDGPLPEAMRRRATSARSALATLRPLAAALDDLPIAATLGEWCAALSRLGARLGLQPFVDMAADPTSAAVAAVAEETSGQNADRAAWRELVRHFTSLARMDARLGEPPRALSLHEMLALFVDVATHEALPRTYDDVGRVLVFSAASARTVSIKHLYLAGMSEQAFPMPEPAGRLYVEAEYRALQRFADKRHAGARSTAPHLATASHKRPGALSATADLRPEGEGDDRHSEGEGEIQWARPQEEMLLFYEVLTRAQESITISYAALDERAQAIPPSPYVTEIERLLGEERVAKRRSPPQLGPMASDMSPLSPSEWRLQAVGRGLVGEHELLAGLLGATQADAPGGAIDAGLRTVHARARRDAFSRCEGLLDSPAVVERLARRFGPQHLWSPSQWELYAACPYKFFLSVVLGLEPLGELTLETDFGRRGGLLHDVLARFHREWTIQAEGGPRNKDQFLARIREVLDVEVSGRSRLGIDAALAELDRRQVARWGEKYFDHLAAYAAAVSGIDQPLAPAHFELRFGPPRPGDAAADDPGSSDRVFELDIGGEIVRVAGRIDRVDVGQVAGRTVFGVIDYKTGRMPSLKEEQIASGERLQLPIYMAAAQALLFKNEATPIAAGYWTMHRGFDQRGALNLMQDLADEDASSERWQALLRLAVERIKQFVGDIRHGDFPVISRDEHCTGRCEFNTVCRVAQVRALGKSWPIQTEE